jgi:PAS domain-containing protein
MRTDIKDVFSGLIENAAVLVLYLDCDGKVALCNKKAQSLIGLEPVQIIGKTGLRYCSGIQAML